MKIIGITGGVGTGKSYIAKLMKERWGAYLILTDDIARHLMEIGQESYEQVKDYFGETVLTECAEIDRRKLADLVFSDPMKLEKLNSFVHPNVTKWVKKEIERKRKEGIDLLLIETAILFEVGYESFCDETWYIYASEEIRRKRLKDSRAYTDEKIDALMKNQGKEEEFRRRADKTICNEGNVDEIQSQIEKNLVK